MNRKMSDRQDMRPEYDFSNGVRGKYYQRYLQSSNVVVLEPDVAMAFPNATAVNDALRGLLREHNVRPEPPVSQPGSESSRARTK